MAPVLQCFAVSARAALQASFVLHPFDQPLRSQCKTLLVLPCLP